MSAISFHVEGQDAEGEWHLLDRPMGVEGDHQAHRDAVIKILRERGVGRYVRVRLVKVTVSRDIIGEEIPV